ncbi:MAG: hypothetical protein LW859_08880 [Anabaena sp. 49633_E8]|nr:hypothetical protein [Anabaena sp. 49633_E8]
MLVGAKHLEDKLSVIAKNSSPNASPVQWKPMLLHLLMVVGYWREFLCVIWVQGLIPWLAGCM